jgi:hypothetical protein
MQLLSKCTATRSFFCLTLILAATTAIAADEQKPIEPKEKIELFNGKDMDGWVSHLKDNTEASKVWSVKDGLLLCVGKPNGYLRTEKSYANYKVTVEWRFAKAGNTGVLVHINGKDKVWPLCVECQGMHNQQGDMYFWSGAKAKELTKGVKVPRKAPDAEKPVGEWNTFQVLCSSDTITILVNDKEMNKTTGGSLTGGQIGIQCEGAQLEVRRVTLEPLPR